MKLRKLLAFFCFDIGCLIERAGHFWEGPTTRGWIRRDQREERERLKMEWRKIEDKNHV